QAADFATGEKRGGFDELFDVLVDLLRPAAEKARFAQAHEGAAQLRLENHGQGEGGEEQESAVEISYRVEVQDAADQGDDQVEADEEDGDALEHADAAGPLQEADDPEDDGADEKELDRHLPPTVAREGPQEGGDIGVEIRVHPRFKGLS